MKTIKVWKKVGTNSNVENIFGFEAFCKYYGITPNQRSPQLYASGDVRGRFIEQVIGELEGNKDSIVENQNIKGKDVQIINSDGVEQDVEIKTTSTVCNFTDRGLKNKSCYLMWNGLKSKENECDYLIFIDAVNFRRFEIPHDDFFTLFERSAEEMMIIYADYDSEKFWLNGDYRSSSKSNNTKLIKQYEII